MKLQELKKIIREIINENVKINIKTSKKGDLKRRLKIPLDEPIPKYILTAELSKLRRRKQARCKQNPNNCKHTKTELILLRQLQSSLNLKQHRLNNR